MMKYAVKCPMLGTIAVFAMINDATEWMEFYQHKYPEMTNMTVVEEPWGLAE